MKYVKFYLIVALVSILAVSTQAQTVELRRLAPFTKIKTGGSWDLILQKGEREEVKLESNNLDLDKVITVVENNALSIRLEKGNYRNINLKVYVTYKDLSEITSSGSGNITNKSDITAGDLAIQLSGSGDARFKSLYADQLSVNMSGSGNIWLSGGKVGRLSVRQSGSGNFNGLELSAEEADIQKSGSGNTSLAVSENLSVRSSGSGNVHYSGNPRHNHVHISGSGKLVKK